VLIDEQIVFVGIFSFIGELLGERPERDCTKSGGYSGEYRQVFFKAHDFPDFLMVFDQMKDLTKSVRAVPVSFPLCRTGTAPRLVIKGERLKAGDELIGKVFMVLALKVEL
jgi:hypothetical protein